ncbi:MAG TPA: hypothetical protein DD490_00610 [Acidobacteria bacterium]|nr:hypothetical protein [Acidobacteriota bacterium]
MSWELDDEEKRLALGLTAPERYSYFIQIAIDEEAVWGLRNEEGWVLGSDPEKGDILPLWPHPAYAEACARGTWDDASPAEVPLDDLLDELLPLLDEDHITVAAFPIPEGDSLLISPGRLDRDLRAEIELGQGEVAPVPDDPEDKP